ncbi:hypothetical protein D910_09001, partial [Dendroctonus ponderosae]
WTTAWLSIGISSVRSGSSSGGKIGENRHRIATDSPTSTSRTSDPRICPVRKTLINAHVTPIRSSGSDNGISDYYYGNVPCLLGREFQYTARKARKVLNQRRTSENERGSCRLPML